MFKIIDVNENNCRQKILSQGKKITHQKLRLPKFSFSWLQHWNNKLWTFHDELTNVLDNKAEIFEKSASLKTREFAITEGVDYKILNGFQISRFLCRK